MTPGGPEEEEYGNAGLSGTVEGLFVPVVPIHGVRRAGECGVVEVRGALPSSYRQDPVGDQSPIPGTNTPPGPVSAILTGFLRNQVPGGGHGPTLLPLQREPGPAGLDPVAELAGKGSQDLGLGLGEVS